MKNITCYDDYANLNGSDIIEMMKDQSREDIEEFKTFCSTPKLTKYADGTEVERDPNFFEIRNWVLDKYYPGVRVSQKKKKGDRLIDVIMEL